MTTPRGTYAPVLVRSLSACVLALVLLANNAVPAAAATRLYVVQRVDSGTNGIDGYVRQPLTTLNQPASEHLASFVNLCSSFTLCGLWVQAGQYQGTGGRGACPGPQCIQSFNAVLSYWENNDPCGTYRIEENARPEANYPYYINWTGASISMPCDGVPTMYKYEVRQGSWTNPPVGTAWLRQSIGVPDAETELLYVNVRPNLGTHRYGLNDAGAIDHGYAMRYYTRATGVWHLWDHAATQAFNDAPLVYDDVEHWSSFRSHD